MKIDLITKKRKDFTECSDEFLTSTRKRIWDIIEERIDKHPTDGLSAEGVYSENIAAQQRSFLHGLRAGRVAAIRCCERAAQGG
jgi:hypothetical protein